LNSRPLSRKSDALTTRLPSHRQTTQIRRVLSAVRCRCCSSGTAQQLAGRSDVGEFHSAELGPPSRRGGQHHIIRAVLQRLRTAPRCTRDHITPRRHSPPGRPQSRYRLPHTTVGEVTSWRGRSHCHHSSPDPGIWYIVLCYAYGRE